MSESSSSSSLGDISSSSFSIAICCSKTSRCALTETYSPAAMEKDPASRPATPARIIYSGLASAPANPITRLKFESSPSLMPNTAARRPPPCAEICHRSVPAIDSCPDVFPSIASNVRLCALSSAGKPAASGWRIYPASSRASMLLMIGTTLCVPNRRAIQPSICTRAEGLCAGTAPPPDWISFAHRCACRSSFCASFSKIAAR